MNEGSVSRHALAGPLLPPGWMTTGPIAPLARVPAIRGASGALIDMLSPSESMESAETMEVLLEKTGEIPCSLLTQETT
jgi:hypothetical protein